jgi:glucose-6-phosphate 1-dehydrogenase
MDAFPHIDPTAVVIFGAAGDLTHRKLLPAFYNLLLEHWLPEPFTVVGVDHVVMDDDQFRHRMREGVDRFSRRGKADDKTWAAFAAHLIYLSRFFICDRAATIWSAHSATDQREILSSKSY